MKQQLPMTVSEYNLHKLVKIQTEAIPLYLEYSVKPSTNPIHQTYQIPLNLPPFINNIHQYQVRKQNKYQTLVSCLSKQPQSAVNIDILSSKSLSKKNFSNIQDSPKAHSSKSNQFQKITNIKINENDQVIRNQLNQDLNFIKSKTTLDQIQAKRSDMFLKMLSGQPICDKLYKNDDFIDQKRKDRGFQREIENKTSGFLTRNLPMEQSIVIKSFDKIAGQRDKGQRKRERKINSLSIELIAIAVIAAFFVSLGANLRASLS